MENMEEKLIVDGIEVTDENADHIIGRPAAHLISQMDNPYIANIFGERVFYTKDFYVAMYKKIHDEGMPYAKAYKALGFNLSVFGRKRAEQAGKRAMEKAKNNTLFGAKPSDYDGTVPMDQMPELSPDEELAYLKARATYLEHLLEMQKKIPSQYLANF